MLLTEEMLRQREEVVSDLGEAETRRDLLELHSSRLYHQAPARASHRDHHGHPMGASHGDHRGHPTGASHRNQAAGGLSSEQSGETRASHRDGSQNGQKKDSTHDPSEL